MISVDITGILRVIRWLTVVHTPGQLPGCQRSGTAGPPVPVL